MTAKPKTAPISALSVTPLSDGPDWTFDLLTQYQAEIERVAKFYQLDYYPNQIEIITAEQIPSYTSLVLVGTTYGSANSPYIGGNRLRLFKTS